MSTRITVKVIYVYGIKTESIRDMYKFTEIDILTQNVLADTFREPFSSKLSKVVLVE